MKTAEMFVMKSDTVRACKCGSPVVCCDEMRQGQGFTGYKFPEVRLASLIVIFHEKALGVK